MSHVAHADAVEADLDAWVFSDPAVSCSGDIACVRSDPSRPSTVLLMQPLAAGISATVEAPDGDVVLPRWSPDGHLLACVVASAPAQRIRIVNPFGDARPDIELEPGWRVEELVWSNQQEIVLLVAPSSTDTAVGTGAVRGATGGPRVERRGGGRRCLIDLSVTDERLRVRPTNATTIWEIEPATDGDVVAVVSDDVSESGWYHARLVVIRRDGTERHLHTSPWQIARPRVSPDGRRVVFVEGWSSDRGHLAGDGRVVRLDDGSTHGWSLPGVDAVGYHWIDDATLHVTGWQGMTSVLGTVGDTGTVLTMAAENEVRTQRAFGSGREPVVVAVTQAAGAGAHLTVRDGSGPWRSVGATAEHDAVMVEPIRWESTGGLEIHGLLVSPPDSPAATCRPIVMIHGGPANLWTTAVPVGARRLVAAGYAVVLPNPRGSIGRGQTFARANLGDPAGAELDDVIAGLTMCRQTGRVLDRPAGVVGGSYGGYLTAAAAVFTDQVGAAVVMFGHPDLVSARFASNNPAFYDILLGGPPSGPTLQRYLDRSPVLHAHDRVPPTLVLHGDADRCTPIGQGDELYRALIDRSVEAELVTYPGAGHGLRTVEDDVWTRTIEWFDRHLTEQGEP